MLILSRKRDEFIDLVIAPSSEPTTITLHPLKIVGKKVRLGLDAPLGVTIHRREVSERIEGEKVS